MPRFDHLFLLRHTGRDTHRFLHSLRRVAVSASARGEAGEEQQDEQGEGVAVHGVTRLNESTQTHGFADHESSPLMSAQSALNAPTAVG